MAETLLPCPFCGHDWPLLITHSSEAATDYSVRCYQGCAETAGDEDKGTAVASWNTRTLASSPTAADLDKDAEIARLTGRIAATVNVIEQGYPGVGKNDKCPHDKHGFEDCMQCYDTALLAALTQGKD